MFPRENPLVVGQGATNAWKVKLYELCRYADMPVEKQPEEEKPFDDRSECLIVDWRIRQDCWGW